MRHSYVLGLNGASIPLIRTRSEPPKALPKFHIFVQRPCLQHLVWNPAVSAARADAAELQKPVFVVFGGYGVRLGASLLEAAKGLPG